MSAAHYILTHVHDRRSGFDSSKLTADTTTTAFLCPDGTLIGRQVGDVWIPPGDSIASRLPPRKSMGSCRGALVSGAANRALVFESTLEYGVAVLLLARRDVEDVIDQPPAVTYRDETGKSHKHTFDFLVLMLDGTRVAIAVKPEARLKASGIEEKVDLIRQQVGTRFADRYVVRTERHIPRNKVLDAELILRARQCRNETDVAAMGKVVADLHGATMIAELVLVSGLGARGFNAALNLIDEGSLVVRSTGPIDIRSTVSRSASQ